MTSKDEDSDGEESSFVTDEKSRVSKTSEEDPRDDKSEEASG
jgi:hypothetical protein